MLPVSFLPNALKLSSGFCQSNFSTCSHFSKLLILSSYLLDLFCSTITLFPKLSILFCQLLDASSSLSKLLSELCHNTNLVGQAVAPRFTASVQLCLQRRHSRMTLNI